MKNLFLFKYLIVFLREYIFIFLTATIFLLVIISKSFSQENVFTINEVEVEGRVDLNFSREKYLNKAFLNSFEVLMTKILLTRDLKKVKDMQLDQIKKLIKSFQILEESYSKDIYKISTRILYNEDKVKKLLGQKNILFSQPENISAVFYPVLFVEGEMQNFNENFFYNEWENIIIKNELINFILPLEDLEDISQIVKMKNSIENLNIDLFINKYDVKNYAFVLMEYQNKRLNVYLQTNFNNNKISKNISHKVTSLDDTNKLGFVLKDLKIMITDLWKEENLINVLMPLSVKLKFHHTNLENLNELRKTFKKISIIDNYTLEEFNINNSFFKIYYYGNPKKLKSELSKFGYQLENIEGFWQLYLNE